MAKKAAPRGKGKKSPDSGGMTPTEIEIMIGVGLIILALITLLSLISTRGELTDAWVGAWRRLLGWAYVVSPLLLGAAGGFLLFDSLDRRPDVHWDQILGLALTFLCSLALLHMTEGFIIKADPAALAEAGRGGGEVGRVLSQGLSDALGSIGAVLVLAAFAAFGLILAAQGTIAQLFRWVGATSTDLADSWRRARLPINSLDRDSDLDLNDIPINSAGRPTEPRPIPAAPLTPTWTPREAPEPEPPPQPRSAVIIGSPEPSATRPPIPAPSATAATNGEAPKPATPTSPKPVVPRVLGGSRDYRLPPVADILEDNIEQEVSRDEIRQKVRIIEETLGSFGVPARVVEVNQGPAITQFGVEPGYVEKKDTKGQVTRSKVKVNKISALSNDLALALAAPTIRIEAPVPGRAMVGIEVPNTKAHVVSLRGVLESDAFAHVSGENRLGIGLGQDVSGQPIAVDITRMPHALIAGATGSGKSACINAIVASLLLTHTPQSLRFLMVDPKRVELVQYNGIPHLMTDVVVDMEQVVGLLQLALREMDRRYKLFAKTGVRNIDGYNTWAEGKNEAKLPFVVIIVDELADLMMVAAEEVERMIVRLAQMARATGIHLLLATQRPSVDVVTGLIKANFPARVAFAVTSQVDSRVILDTPGAEKLLGRGDMLYMAPDASKLLRLQGCYVSDRELDRLVRYWKGMGPKLGDMKSALPQSLADEDKTAFPDPNAWPPAPTMPTARPPLTPKPGSAAPPPPSPAPRVAPRPTQPPIPGLGDTDLDNAPTPNDGRDDLWQQAIEVVKDYKTASASLLQRKLRIGYPRAAKLIEDMEKAGVLGPPQGPTKARAVLIQHEEHEDEDDTTW